MMRSMRQITKWVFAPLAVIFILWLAIGQVQEIVRGGADTVLKVNGTDVHNPQFQNALQSALAQYRQQNGGGQLTDDEEKQVEDRVVDQLVQEVALEQTYRRLGITVSDQELVDAARNSPPPEIMQSPDFQTNKQFDMAKWQRFLASGTNPEFLLALEDRYRQQIPQLKLAQYLTADVYVPDAKLWRIWRDQHDSVTVTLVSFVAQGIPDSAAPVTSADLSAYYAAHQSEFKRAAVAYTSFIAQPRFPDAADSAAALAKARRLRAQAAVSDTAFATVAHRESDDTVSGSKGGDLGWIKKHAPDFDEQFLAGMRGTAVGQVSQPVLSQFGYHLIRVLATKGDSMKVRHILVNVALQGPHLDLVEGRADTLDRIAAEHDDGSVIDVVGKQFGLPVAKAPALIQGDRLTLGRYVVPDVGTWAFGGARVGQTSKVIEGERAYYVFRLDSLRPAGVPPLDEIQDQVRFAARMDKKKTAAHTRALAAATALQGATDLMQAAAAHGFPAQKMPPFPRIRPPGLLQGEPTLVGAAFGLRVGERTGLLSGEHGDYLIQSLARTSADSAVWWAQRDQQRETLLQSARQSRIQAFLAALKAKAKVVDRRQELFKAQTAAGS